MTVGFRENVQMSANLEMASKLLPDVMQGISLFAYRDMILFPVAGDPNGQQIAYLKYDSWKYGFDPFTTDICDAARKFKKHLCYPALEN
jgi:hypothetical protein